MNEKFSVMTEGQLRLLEQRRAAFSTYFSEMMPVLADFCRLLELPNPELVVADPWLYFTPIANWIDELEQHELPSIANRPWLVARLGYLIGELMANRFRGCWYVEHRPESRYFARYVVGQFHSFPTACIDPNDCAVQFLDAPNRTPFGQFIADIEKELCALKLVKE
jgi:hypothetical protein